MVFRTAGTTIDLAKELPGLFSTGVVYCPLPEAVCPTLSCGSSGCGPNADCWQGSCKCHMGYTGGLGCSAGYAQVVPRETASCACTCVWGCSGSCPKFDLPPQMHFW